ncbi:MAG: tetratricopeptide repeat protein [Asgard group archaeon]|nr:tetratricopeptide repeat protein [Asgard group archaeon]
MSSSFDDQLKKVNELIVHGKLKEAYKIIEEIKKKEISKVEKLQFLAFKSELELYFGNFDESIQLADKILQESKEVDNSLLEVDALNWKAVDLFFNGKTDVSLQTFDKALTQLSKIKNLPAKDLAKRKARLLFWKAYVISRLGDPNRALEYANEALSFAEKSGYKNLVSRNLLVIGECYQDLGERERGNGYFEKALTIANELGNKYMIAYCYIFLARTPHWIREQKKVEELYRKGLSLAEEIGAKMLFVYKVDFGNFYRVNFQFDNALKLLHESLETAPIMNWLSNLWIGHIYFSKFELEKSQDYYLKTMRFCEEINDKNILPFTLYDLINISIELKNPLKAKEYLKRLGELKEETDFDRIDQIYRLGSILILKVSGNLGDLAKATELLDALLAEERLLVIDRLNLFYSLLEIRLKELQLTPSEDALREVQKRLFHLEVEAKEQQLKYLLANVYRLQSQLALVELDIKNAIDLLEKAQAIAEEIKIELLKNRIKKDQEKIKQQLTMFQKFQEQQAPISETMKHIPLEQTVQSIKQETVIEERDKETGQIIEYRKLFSLKI